MKKNIDIKLSQNDLINLDMDESLDEDEMDVEVEQNEIDVECTPGLRGKPGEKGEDGHTPTKEELLPIIKPLIPKKKDLMPTKTDLIEAAEEVITDEKVLNKIVKNIPKPKDGEKGEDGKSFRFDDLTPYQKQILTGPPGSTGVGVPRGGTVNQVLAKSSSRDFDTEWVTGGGGGLSSFTSPDYSIIIAGDLLNPTVILNTDHSYTFTKRQGINFDSNNDTETESFNVQFNKDGEQVDTDYGYSSIYAGVSDTSNISGTIEDKIVQKSGFEVGMFRSCDSTVNWIDGREVVRGYTSYVAYSGLFEGSKHDVEMTGHDITVLHTINFSNEGTHLHEVYGNKINVLSTSFVNVDCYVTRKLYGDYIEVAASNGGDVTEAYGIYIKTVESDGTKYAIYSEVDAISHFEGDIEVPHEAYNATSWNGNFEVPTKKAIRDKIESLGGGGMSWVTAPTNPTDTGTSGQVAYDSTYFYVCIATDTWMRVSLSTWVGGNFLLFQDNDPMLFQDSSNFLLQAP